MMTNYEDGYKQAEKDYKDICNTDCSFDEAKDKLWSNLICHQTGFFYTNKRGKRDYKIITTRFDKGYEKALIKLVGLLGQSINVNE